MVVPKMGDVPLPVRDRMVLQIAGRHYRHEGRRASDMLELVGYTEPRFWRRVRFLLELPEAVAAEPVICGRLRRLHEGRRAQRAGRRAS